MNVNPHETYKTYLALKNHFTKTNYDYHKYCGKVNASLQSFYKRRDRFFFEKISRQKTDEEIVNFFVSNFVSCSDPQSLWIGEIMKEGEPKYKEWQKKIQSLSYFFKEESEVLFSENNLNSLFEIKNGSHPIVLKKFLGGEISLETFVIYNKIFQFEGNFDKKLLDPVWETVSLKIKKYNPFLQINIFDYKKILKNIIL
jgi:hypothetical protein